MGLFQQAYETYEYAAKDYCGVYVEGMAEPLIPVCHWITKATIEITLNASGEFIQASFVANSDSKTIYPVTEKSLARTSTAKEPHPLCEKLKNITPENTEYYEKYLSQLSQWAESPFSHPIILAVLKYMKKASIVKDLKEANLLKFDENGNLQKDHFIRWIIAGIEPEINSCWKNRNLFSAYISWYKCQQEGNLQYCMITGNMAVPAKSYNKGIIPSKPTAKLISANDKEGATFRGRFADEFEALSVGFEANQKSHNALRWIVATQGDSEASLNGRCFVCWCPAGKELPKPTGIMKRKNTPLEKKYTPNDYRDNLRKVMNGWKAEYFPSDNAVTAVIDSATKGRLSLIYYNEVNACDFIERLGYWDETCCWETPDYGIQPPLLSKIADYAFGTLQKKKIEADTKIKKSIMLQLVKCRIENGHIPKAVYEALVQKCGNLQLFPDDEDYHYLRRDFLYTTCAVIRKYHIDYLKEECEMALDPNKRDRSYQFGRLMAIMEKIEKDTFDDDEKRETNIIRRQTAFVMQPNRVFVSVMEHLKTAYYPQLKVSSKQFYEITIESIMEILSDYESDLNKPLGDTYLLGYYLQKKELYQKKTK